MCLLAFFTDGWYSVQVLVTLLYISGIQCLAHQSATCTSIQFLFLRNVHVP